MGGIRAISVERCCGFRTEGDVYVECGLSPFGRPIEYFLMDPPVRYQLPVQYVGVRPFQRKDPETGEMVVHLLDHVGRDNYRVADMVEEIRRYGLSRKIPKTQDMSVFIPGKSKIFLSHSEAMVLNLDKYRTQILPNNLEWFCCSPYENIYAEHTDKKAFPKFPDDCCSGFWWYDVPPGKYSKLSFLINNKDILKVFPNPVVVDMPTFHYIANERPADFEPEYQEAIFAAFPITAIAVIAARDNSHKGTLDRIQKQSHIPVFESDK